MAGTFKNWVPPAGSFGGFTSPAGAGAFRNWVPPASSYSGFIAAPGQATAPGAPTSVVAVAGNANAVITWTAPASDGGSAILSYTVTSSPATTPQVLASGGTFTGLTNGVAYTFTVTATNAIGTGPASAASNSVTPSAPFVPPTNLYFSSTDLTDSGIFLNFFGTVATAAGMVGSEQSYDLTNDGTNGGHILLGTGMNSGSCTKIGFVAKPGTLGFLGIKRSSSVDDSCAFDLTLGTISLQGANILSAQCQAQPGGYFYCEITMAASSAGVQIRPAPTAAAAAANANFIGAGTINVYHAAAT